MPKASSRITRSSLRHAFREIIWPRRGLVLVGLLLILVNRLSGLVLPASTKYVIDDVIAEGETDLLWPILGALVAAVTVQALTSFGLTRLLSVEAQRLIAELRAQVQRHVLRLPVRSFETTRSGELVSRIMDDVEGVRNLVGTGLVQLVGGTLTAMIALVFLLRIDAWMTLLALVPLALFAFVSTRAFGSLRPAFRERGKIRAEVTGRLTESLGGIRIVKGFHALDREGKVFHDGVQRMFENVRTTLTTTAAVTPRCTPARPSSMWPSARPTTPPWSPQSRPPVWARPCRATALSPCSPPPMTPSPSCLPGPWKPWSSRPTAPP